MGDFAIKQMKSKIIRFSELVKRSGKPESVTLWTKPRANPSFMKAVRENRVLTIVQQTTGTKKERGQIGFHEQHAAIYLVFPKPLPKAAGDYEVIGIHYELLADAEAEQPGGKQAGKRSEKSKPQPPPKPETTEFKVTILRTATSHIDVIVTAEDRGSAGREALEKVKRMKFKPDEIRDEVKSMVEQGLNSP